MKRRPVTEDMILKNAKNTPELVEVQKQVRMKMATQLAEKRRARRMTQADVSVITGIKRSNISRLESGGYNPTLDSIVRIADSIGLKVNITFSEK